MKSRSRPKIVKLTQAQVRTLVNEAIQHKPIGEPEPQLHEAGPNAVRIDQALLVKELNANLDDISQDWADNLVYNFRQKIVNQTAHTMNSHGMASFKINPQELEDNMSAMGSDDVMEMTQECVADITNALAKYAKEMGKYAISVAAGEEDPLQ